MQLVQSITDETTFLFNKAQFRNIVDIIPYMEFDNDFVCLWSILIEHIFFTSFKIARQINYFKCDSAIIFKDISELLSHLKPLVEYPIVTDNIHRYHQILYFWLIIYRQIKIQSCSGLILPNNDKQTQIENVHRNMSNINLK